MADDSPGKVQALRAIFAEKNKPVMGMMPPGGKISNRPWQRFTDSAEDLSTLKEKTSNEQNVPSQSGTKVFPFQVKKLEVIPSVDRELLISEKELSKVSLKPSIGPKPSYLSQQKRANSTLTLDSEALKAKVAADFNEDTDPRSRTFSYDQSYLNSKAKSKAVAETIASFMFTNGFSNKENDTVVIDTCNKNSVVPIPKPRASQVRTNLHDHTQHMNVCNSQSDRVLSECDTGTCNVISYDNYICKTNCNLRRKVLPSADKLGPAPLKPIKPYNLKLPAKCSLPQSVCPSAIQCSQMPPNSAPALPQKLVLQRPSYPCPPRPQTPPPLPPVLAPVIRPPASSLREEIEELYEDTLLGDSKRPVSLIPEYTEEEEQEELYNDAGEVDDDVPNFSVPASPVKPKIPPPPCPSEYLQPNVHGSVEELYQDAEDPCHEEFYEEMPCDTHPEETGFPLYSNNRKEIEKLKREEEKKVRKEQKEREKREREMEKLKKKFGLTGEEIPIDDGLVKADSRGGKGDLPVKKGETVLILRMEGNPSGRWLVKNEKGKIGYVELTNIEVDPLSVKSVMAIRRLSVISASEELYSEARSEEEAIYEVTY